jgi:hypothetical protein
MQWLRPFVQEMGARVSMHQPWAAGMMPKLVQLSTLPTAKLKIVILQRATQNGQEPSIRRGAVNMRQQPFDMAAQTIATIRAHRRQTRLAMARKSFPV